MKGRRYIWDATAHELVELTDTWAPSPRMELITDAPYEGVRAPDGVPINTRKRYRDYLKATGGAPADDFKQTWQKARTERDAFYSGKQRNKEGLEATARAVYSVASKWK